jgi:hypothetical protein
MTLAVAGLWELGHNVPLSEADLWTMVVRDFKVDEWHMAPVTGIANRRVQEHGDAKEMVDALRARFGLVFVTEDAQCELRHFVHPRGDACYVVGKCNYSPFLNLKIINDWAVRLDTPANDALLWPHQCLATVLWHRWSTWQ